MRAITCETHWNQRSENCMFNKSVSIIFIQAFEDNKAYTSNKLISVLYMLYNPNFQIEE